MKTTPFMMPWGINHISKDAFEVVDAHGYRICTVFVDLSVESPADLARLMVASPELREAVESLLEAPVMGLVDQPEYDVAKDLLAKVDGKDGK